MIFNLFIRNVTFFWTEIGIHEANYRSITSVFPFLLFEKRGGHSRIQFIDQYYVFVRSSIQIPDQQGLKIRLIDAEMQDSLSPSLISTFIWEPRLRKICVTLSWDLMHVVLILIEFSFISKIIWCHILAVG